MKIFSMVNKYKIKRVKIVILKLTLYFSQTQRVFAFDFVRCFRLFYQYNHLHRYLKKNIYFSYLWAYGYRGTTIVFFSV